MEERKETNVFSILKEKGTKNHKQTKEKKNKEEESKRKERKKEERKKEKEKNLDRFREREERRKGWMFKEGKFGDFKIVLLEKSTKTQQKKNKTNQTKEPKKKREKYEKKKVINNDVSMDPNY